MAESRDGQNEASVRDRVLALVKREFYCAAQIELGPEALTDLIMDTVGADSEHTPRGQA